MMKVIQEIRHKHNTGYLLSIPHLMKSLLIVIKEKQQIIITNSEETFFNSTTTNKLSVFKSESKEK